MAEVTEGAIDSFLLTAIKIPKDKIFILKLDKELEVFLNDKSRTKLCFPQMNSYQRRVVHRVADYFNLSHSLDSDKKAIILRKNERSAIPAIRMSDFIEVEDDQPKVSLKIMQRSTTTETNTRVTRLPKPSSVTDQTKLSLEEREAKYQQARARIFNETTTINDTKPTQPTITTATTGTTGSYSQLHSVKPFTPKIDQTKLKHTSSENKFETKVDTKVSNSNPNSELPNSPSPGSSRRGDKPPFVPKTTSLAYLPNNYYSPNPDPTPFIPSYKLDSLYSANYANETTGFGGDNLHYGLNQQPTTEPIPPPDPSYHNHTFYEPYNRQYFPPQSTPYYPGQFQVQPFPNYEPSSDSSDTRLNTSPGPTGINPVSAPLPPFGTTTQPNPDPGNGFPPLPYPMHTPQYGVPQPGLPYPYEDTRYRWNQEPHAGYLGYPQYSPAGYVHHYPNPYQHPVQVHPQTQAPTHGMFQYQPTEFMRRPPAKNRELFDPNKPSHTSTARRSNSGSSTSSRQSDNTLADQFNRSLSLSGSKPSSGTGMRSKKPENLLYDYSGDSYEGVRPTDKPVQPNHILEVCDFDPSDPLDELTSAGATIRRLKSPAGGATVLAVFKNSGLASKHLTKFTQTANPRFKLRIWVPTLYDPSKAAPLKSPSVPVSPVPESIAPPVN